MKLLSSRALVRLQLVDGLFKSDASGLLSSKLSLALRLKRTGSVPRLSNVKLHILDAFNGVILKSLLTSDCFSLLRSRFGKALGLGLDCEHPRSIAALEFWTPTAAV